MFDTFNNINAYALKYSDVFLIPNHCKIKSRKEADTSVKLGKNTFKIPIVPANMVCSIDEYLAHKLAKNNYFYIYHRFGDTLNFSKNTKKENLTISISVGVGNKDILLLKQLKSEDIEPDYITIDIAHGHADSVLTMIDEIKSIFPQVFVIAGNVATAEGVLFLEKGGADATKVGIGQGKACTTKLKTGFTVPMFTCVLECTHVNQKPIIADGGIEHNGDIAKAIVAGATMVMAGGMFAKLIESPAPRIDNKIQYYGSASDQNKLRTGSSQTNIEGATIDLNCEYVTYLEKLKEIEEDLQSAISYAGGTKLKDLTHTQVGVSFN